METGAVLGEFGCDWEAGAVLGPFEGINAVRRPQKSGVEKSCG